MSPGIETFDPLLGGDLPVLVVRSLFKDNDQFMDAITALPAADEVCLLDDDEKERASLKKTSVPFVLFLPRVSTPPAAAASLLPPAAFAASGP